METDLWSERLTSVFMTGGSSECLSPGNIDWGSGKLTMVDESSGGAVGCCGATVVLGCNGGAPIVLSWDGGTSVTQDVRVSLPMRGHRAFLMLLTTNGAFRALLAGGSASASDRNDLCR